MNKLVKTFKILTGGYLEMLPEEVPLEDREAAIKQWKEVSKSLIWKVILTYFPMGMLAALTTKPTTNAFGQTSGDYGDRYRAEGASPDWEYEATHIGWLDDYNIWEDSATGEIPSGKHSARCNTSWWGKLFYKGVYAERSWLGKYLYITRNPFNKGKRTSDFYSCFVNECDLTYWGKKDISDKNNNPTTKGWQFTKAVHKETGKTYYGYREVNLIDDKHVEQIRIGHKIKPSHIGNWQEPSDVDKAYTSRYQWKSEIN